MVEVGFDHFEALFFGREGVVRGGQRGGIGGHLKLVLLDHHP